MPSSKIKNIDFHAREPALKKDILMQSYLSIFATVTVKLKMSPQKLAAAETIKYHTGFEANQKVKTMNMTAKENKVYSTVAPEIIPKEILHKLEKLQKW